LTSTGGEPPPSEQGLEPPAPVLEPELVVVLVVLVVLVAVAPP
jgi:hypothetical protein